MSLGKETTNSLPFCDSGSQAESDHPTEMFGGSPGLWWRIISVRYVHRNFWCFEPDHNAEYIAGDDLLVVRGGEVEDHDVA